MATLSANSRRNSAATSVTNSPRPSLSNPMAITPVHAVTHMSSLNEEEYTADEPIADAPDHAVPIRMSKDNICTERSDSGFSDCSNSSGNTLSNGNTLSAHPLFDKANSISEERLTADATNTTHSNEVNILKEMGGKVSVNMLKMKLEKIAESQVDLSLKPIPLTRNVNAAIEHEEPKSIFTLKSTKSAVFDVPSVTSATNTEQPEKPKRASLARSTSLQLKKVVDKEPIMKSDFTNTVKMRKKSLETNVMRDKQPVHHHSSPRVLLEKSGKVSKLLQRFSSEHGTSFSEKDFTEKFPQENALVECTSTPMSVVAVAQQPVVTKVVVAKATIGGSSRSASIVSTQSVKRSPSPDRKPRSFAVANARLDRKSVFERLSPTRHTNSNHFTNTRSHVNASQSVTISTASTNNKSKSIKSNTVVSSATATATHTTTTAAAATSTVKNSVTTATAQKSSVYASFNRTSPVRLSGRVKEVTERLSTPKSPKSSLRKPFAVRPTAVISASAYPSAAVALTKTHAKHMSDVTEACVTTAIVTPSFDASTITQTNQIVTNTMSIENYQSFVSNKIEGDFATKSQQINENFKKASAFWKTS